MYLIDYSEYLQLKRVSEIERNVVVPNKLTISLAKYIEYMFPIVTKISKVYDFPKEFYNKCKPVDYFLDSLKFHYQDVDFCLDGNNVYTKYSHDDLKSEIFFCMRNGVCYEGVPSSLYFYCRKYMDTFFPISYLPKVLPEDTFKDLTSGFFKNPISLISSIIGRPFNIITQENLYVPGKKKGTIEMYIISTDRVAIVPENILDKITLSDIQSISLHNNLLCIGHTPLHEICGKYGVYTERGLYDIDACT